MGEGDLKELLAQYKQDYSELTRRLNDVVNENTVLVQKLNDRNARPIAPLATTNAPTQNENFELNAQLRETEQNLTHEREQVVKAMAQELVAKNTKPLLNKRLTTKVSLIVYWPIEIGRHVPKTKRTVEAPRPAIATCIRSAEARIREKIRSRLQTKQKQQNWDWSKGRKTNKTNFKKNLKELYEKYFIYWLYLFLLF